MKKALLFLASAALFLIGCNKEQLSKGEDSGMITATFTANLESGVVTRAAADGDGAAANVNRCIMEIYYGDALYARQISKVTDKQATFNAQVVSNRGYTVAFWADCVDDTTTVHGLAADKYYNTASLKEITFKSSYVGNDDARDAFYVCEPFTVQQTGGSFSATLKRPFAQMNVITTDWDKAASVTGLAPEKVNVTLKNALVNFNAVTGEASGSQDITYEAAVYTAPAPEESVSATDKTLSMDYLFASATKGVIDIDWKALHGTDIDVKHTFAAVPYQRNYRTNIKGALLTTQGKWTVTVDPIWKAPAHEKLVVATTVLDIEGMNDFVESHTDADQIDVTFSAEPNDAGVPTTEGTANAIVTSKLKKNSDLNVTVASDTKTLYVGDFKGEKDITVVETSNAATVNITVPQGKKIETLVINAPFKSVYLNGQQISGGVGTLTNVEATTSEHTLVVAAGQSIGTLTVHQGGLEIHGTVGTLQIEETAHETNPVQVRACEGLSADVFAAIKGEGHDYIDSPMYAYKQVGEKYDIYKLPVVAMIGEVEYPSIAAAVAAVPADNTELVTIKVMSDVAINSSSLTINKNNVVLDGQNHTIAIDETDASLDKYLVDGTSKKYGSFQMINVSGNDVTLKNLTLDCKDYRGASLATTCGGKNVSYENIIYKGLGSGHYYGSAGGDGTLKFKNCTFETHGYAIHTAECQSVLEVSDCEIHGWVSYGDKTKSATFTNTHFYSTTDQYNGVIATIRPYCATTITNCTFSKEYLVKYKYDGLTVRSNVVVSLKGCSVEEGELCDIANITCPDDPWAEGGVIAIDATGNATNGFTAGTFVAKQAEDIKVSSLSELKTVEGKQYVYKVSVIPVAKIGETEYETLQAAFNAVPDGIETTITLNADATCATLGDKNNIGAKTVILNLNGHSITGHMRGISTLTGSSSLEGATLVNYANLTINGEGTIGDLEGEYHHNALVNMSDGTNLTINGGTFVAKSCCVYHYSASSEANTASININGGNFKSYENAATNKYVFGIGGKSGQILTFNYGNAIAEASVEGAKGIYCSLAGTTINVHSGSITANINAIYLSMGKNVTINIDGGTLETLDSENHANNYNSSGSYCGSSLPIYASAFGSENIVCNISGGIFKYPYYSYQLNGTIPATWERVINAGVGITSNVANANIKASLTGGTYSTNQMLSDITNDQSAASGIVANGYTCKKNDDGTWTVVAAN